MSWTLRRPERAESLEKKGGYPAGSKTPSQMKPPPASITRPKTLDN